MSRLRTLRGSVRPCASITTFKRTRVLLRDSPDTRLCGPASTSVIVPPQSVTDLPVLKMTLEDYSRTRGACRPNLGMDRLPTDAIYAQHRKACSERVGCFRSSEGFSQAIHHLCRGLSPPYSAPIRRHP